MNKISLKFTWLFVLIPIGMLFFVGVPQFQRNYKDFNERVATIEKESLKLDSLKQLKNPVRRDINEITKLNIWVPVHKQSIARTKFMYYKTGGMLLVLAMMFLGMFGTSYLTNKKKNSPNNKQVDFTFEDPDKDAIGQHISWEATTNSGSNFLSEQVKKTTNGYKITSTNYMKVFAWAFFLIGLNYLVFSIVEFYQVTTKTMTFMEGGKLFFTSGGPFLLVGLFLLLMSSTKVFIHVRKRKIVIGGEVISFQQVYALQVLEKFIQGSSSGSYYTFEVNLVTTEGKRYNLLNHGDKQYLLSDMVKISKLLRVPVWNRGVV